MELSAVLLQLISDLLPASLWGWVLFHTWPIPGFLGIMCR